MGRKYRDLDSREQEELEETIDLSESKIRNENRRTDETSDFKRFGLCSRCTRMRFAKSEFRVIFAFCKMYGVAPIFLDARHPVQECSEFHEKTTAPSLIEMQRMATIIDIPKRGVGF